MGENIYNNNLIWCFAADLWANARALYQKREGNSYLHQYPNYVGGLGSRSRIIIVGHGDAASSFFMGDHGQWDAVRLAREIRECLQNQVKRISFHMCCSAKAQQNGSIHESFAHKFASVCDFAEEITARTDVMNVSFGTRQGRYFAEQTVNGVHRPAGWKVFYKPTGGTLATPRNPEVYTY